MSKLLSRIYQAKRLITTFESELNPITKEHGLNVGQYLVLREIDKLIAVGELVEKTDMSGGNITYITDKLHNLNLIERSFSSNDRRKVFVQRTSEGSKVVKKIEAHVKKVLEPRFL
jgi:MarR family 2-MHQ and catechol resistance regulon transcriptional repressor